MLFRSRSCRLPVLAALPCRGERVPLNRRNRCRRSPARFGAACGGRVVRRNSTTCSNRATAKFLSSVC